MAFCACLIGNIVLGSLFAFVPVGIGHRSCTFLRSFKRLSKIEKTIETLWSKNFFRSTSVEFFDSLKGRN